VRRRAAAKFRQPGQAAKRGAGGSKVASLEADCGAAVFHAHDGASGDQVQVHVFGLPDRPADMQLDTLSGLDGLVDGEQRATAADVEDPAPTHAFREVVTHR